MIHVPTPVYPELRQLFGAYLNADFATQYGSAEKALAAYRHETGPGHRAAGLAGGYANKRHRFRSLDLRDIIFSFLRTVPSSARSTTEHDMPACQR